MPTRLSCPLSQLATPAAGHERRVRATATVGLAAAALAGLALLPGAAAHEGGDPLATWLRSLQTADGQSCCSMHDCAPADARLAKDRWEVWIVPYEGDPKWVSVPERAILRRTNPDGRPILCRTPNGFIRCFIPPAGS